MRIISGKFRSKVIMAPESLPVRPTTDMAKEALFNWLAFRMDFEEITALDLFAGTGNITYELMSRGTERIVCVDKHPACVRFISDTIKKLGAGRGIELYNTDAVIALERVKMTFDFIFADPPFDYPDHKKIVTNILDRKLLKEDGWLAVEHPKNVDLKDVPGFAESRHYGKVYFSFFQLPD